VRETLGPTPRFIPATSRNKLVNQYFRAGNDDEKTLKCNLAPVKKSVSKKKMKAVLTRDNRRCLICGSGESLVVDHIQALENGGSNSVHNLSILCKTCRKTKAKFDKSLVSKRQSLCRK